MKNLTLLVGDSAGILKDIPAGSVQLTVTSPPYDNLRKYNGYSFDFEAIAQQLYRVTKPGGVVVWVVADQTIKGSETGTSFRQALMFMEIGFNLHDTMIYHKDNPPPVGGPKRYYQSFEYMFVFANGIPQVMNALMVPRRNKWNDKRTERKRSISRNQDGNFAEPVIVKINDIVRRQNIWTYTVSGGSIASDWLAHKHPAIFPEKLAEDHILTWSNPGDVVLDPFCGSGTVGKMAIRHNRSFIGIDASKEYIALAKKRITSFADPIAYKMNPWGKHKFEESQS